MFTTFVIAKVSKIFRIALMNIKIAYKINILKYCFEFSRLICPKRYLRVIIKFGISTFEYPYVLRLKFREQIFPKKLFLGTKFGHLHERVFIQNKALWSFETKFDHKSILGQKFKKKIVSLRMSLLENLFVLSVIKI